MIPAASDAILTLQDLLNSMFLADYISQRPDASEDQEGTEPPQPDIPVEDTIVKVRLQQGSFPTTSAADQLQTVLCAAAVERRQLGKL